MIRTFDSHAHRGAAFASLAHRARQAATELRSQLSRTARDMLKMTRLAGLPVIPHAQHGDIVKLLCSGHKLIDAVHDV